MKVMGVDIIKGNPLSKTNPPFYSVVIIDNDGKIVYESVESPLKALIRLAWEYEVSRIGIDNIFELAPTRRDIAKIIALLPSNTILYQVTLEENKFVNLYKQAMKIGVEFDSKPRPLQTAYVCALLVLNDVGTPIKGVESRTKIIISRARSIGSGGSSANRFARGMRTAILCAVKEIRRLLENATLPYDIIFRRGSGGLDSAVFIVYANSDIVKKIVKPFTGKDIRVAIKPEYTTIEFIEKELNKKPVIVGVDPGIETGLAVMDLSLKNITLISSRELDKINIINKIYSIGTPIIIATDKNPPPDTVKKIASLIGIPLYSPSQSLSNEEKERLIDWVKKKGIEIHLRTSHERDALAAALKLYKSFERKFIELERRIDELGLDIDIDELKLFLLRGKTINEAIEYAIEEYLDRELHHLENTQSRLITIHSYDNTSSLCDEKTKNLEERLKDLVREREILRTRINELETRVKELEFELKFNNNESDIDKEIIKDRVINELKEKLKNIQNKISHLELGLEQEKLKSKLLYEILKGFTIGEFLAIPKIKALTIEEIRNTEKLNSSSKAVLIESSNLDVEALNIIKNLKIAVIINFCNDNLKQYFLEMGIPILCGLPISMIYEDIAIVNTKEFENALRNAWNELELYRKSKENRNSINITKLLNIIDEYRKTLWNG